LAEHLRRLWGHRFPRLGVRPFRFIVGRLPSPHLTELQPGLVVPIYPARVVEITTWWQGIRYEAPTASILLGWLASADRFFDIGANYGWYSYLALSRAPHLGVVAFEPNPELVERMRQVKQEHALSRFLVEQTALADAAGTAPLHLGGDPAHATLGDHPHLPATGQLVQVETFDRWCAHQGIPLPTSPRWVAKIDAEGFERKILLGMEASLQAQAFSGLVVELNEYTLAFCGTSAAEVVAELARHGYRRLEVSMRDEVENGFFVPAAGERQRRTSLA